MRRRATWQIPDCSAWNCSHTKKNTLYNLALGTYFGPGTLLEVKDGPGEIHIEQQIIIIIYLFKVGIINIAEELIKANKKK